MSESSSNQPVHGRQGTGRAFTLISYVQALMAEYGDDYDGMIDAARRASAPHDGAATDS